MFLLSMTFKCFSQWGSFAATLFQTHWYRLEIPWNSTSSQILWLQNLVSK